MVSLGIPFFISNTVKAEMEVIEIFLLEKICQVFQIILHPLIKDQE